MAHTDPIGSRPEPGAYLFASTLRLPPGEVPEGKAVVQVQSRSDCAYAHSKAAAGALPNQPVQSGDMVYTLGRRHC